MYFLVWWVLLKNALEYAENNNINSNANEFYTSFYKKEKNFFFLERFAKKEWNKEEKKRLGPYVVQLPWLS